MASLPTQGPAAPDLFNGLLPASSSPVNQSSETVVGNGSAAGPGSQAITPFQSLQLVHQLKGLIVLLYSIVVVVGLVGNCLLVLVIARVRRLHNVTNFLIGNLALSDVLMCTACVPLTLAYAFEPRGWVFGGGLCHLVFFLQPVTVYVSVFTLTTIAVDRYVVLVHPLRRRISLRFSAYAVLAIWALSAVLALPAALHTYHVELKPHRVRLCEEFWGSQERQRQLYACRQFSGSCITYNYAVCHFKYGSICYCPDYYFRSYSCRISKSNSNKRLFHYISPFCFLTIHPGRPGMLSLHVYNVDRSAFNKCPDIVCRRIHDTLSCFFCCP